MIISRKNHWKYGEKGEPSESQAADKCRADTGEGSADAAAGLPRHPGNGCPVLGPGRCPAMCGELCFRGPLFLIRLLRGRRLVRKIKICPNSLII